MLDKEDVPIIIDFDSCQREGDLSFGIGTPGWTNGSITGISKRKNDDFGLMQLYKNFLKDSWFTLGGVKVSTARGIDWKAFQDSDHEGQIAYPEFSEWTSKATE